LFFITSREKKITLSLIPKINILIKLSPDITQIILYTIIFIIRIYFIQINHPLAIGLVLLIQTLFICFITGFLTKTFWFSYILFLVFLGGILVLFIYVTSLASNEIFNLSIKLIILSLIILILTIIINFFIDKNIIISFLNNNEIIQNIIINFIKENNLNLNKLYNYPSNIITLLLINYLLITLIAIVKITNIFYGPLRPIN